MHYATTSAVVMAAICIGEVVAGPAHAHAHQRAHKGKRGDWSAVNWDDVDYTGVDWAKAYAEGQASISAAAAALLAKPTTAPASSTSVVAVATSTPEFKVADKVEAASTTLTTSSKAAAATTVKGTSALESAVASISSDLATLWNDVVGMANDLTAFGTATVSSGVAKTNAEGVDLVGNIGSPQGSNMIKVDSREGYDFTNEFINTSGESMTIMLWNKAYSTTGAAKDAQANSGSCFAPTNPSLSIALAPGASQIVAFQASTQMGFAQATSETAASGAFATAWGEVNYLTTGSGYDLSAIMNPAGNTYNMSISATETDCISDMTQNFWLTDSQPIGTSDGSCFVSGKTATMTTLMGGTV